MSTIQSNRLTSSSSQAAVPAVGSSALASVRPAGVLRVVAGAPVGTVVRARRRGSFLVLVVGTLALLAVITIVYVALGNQDTRTKAAVQRRAAVDDVPAQVAQYAADVIARDIFSTTLDGATLQQGVSAANPNGGALVPALTRETDDAPGIVFRQGDQASAYTVRSDRTAGIAPLAARELFTPEGTIHPTLEQALLLPNSTVADEFVLGGAQASFRLPSSDPWLAAHRPVAINWTTATSGSAGYGDFASAIDRPFLDQLDWAHITNIAPDGMFVNLANLRNNFDAFHNTDDGSLNDNQKPGLGFGKSLLAPVGTSGPDRFRFESSLDTSWGETLTVGSVDDRPAYWTMWQRGAFRPAKVAQGGTGGPAEDPTNADFKLYQWADADGDGMLDSRWWALDRWQDATGATINLPGEAALPQLRGGTRWFIASRIVDLSGLVNVNTAGDLMASPIQPLSVDGLVINAPNTSMAVGMTPADIDLRRLLAQLDTYANHDPELAGEPAGYEGWWSGLGVVGDRYITGASAISERRAYSLGTMAYANLQLSKQVGKVLGNQAQESDTSFRDLSDDHFLTAASNPPESSRFNYAEEVLALGGLDAGVTFTGNATADAIRNQFGRRGWQAFAYPSRPYDAGIAPIQFFPPYGVDDNVSISTHHGWIDFAARRTLRGVADQRRVFGAFDTPALLAAEGSRTTDGLRFGISDLEELLRYRTINDPTTTSALETALGVQDLTDLGVADAAEFFSILRSNRELAAEAYTYDWAQDFAQDPSTNETKVTATLRRLATDVRQYLTTVSASRPLRAQPARDAIDQLRARGRTASRSLVSDGKIDAREILDLTPRPAPEANQLPEATRSSETAARLLFEGYADALAPYASLDAGWVRTNAAEFNAVRTLFYGYRGAEMATLTAATMAVNMVDLADGPIFAPSEASQDVYVEDAAPAEGRANEANLQTQPVRPGTSDPFDQPTIRTLILTDEPAVRNALNNAQVNAANGIAAAFPTWQRDVDIAGGRALDNLDISSDGRLAPSAADTIEPVVKLYGIEAQPFLTQVTTMSVYFDNYVNSTTGFNTGTRVELRGPVDGPTVITNPASGTTPARGLNQIRDGETENLTEILFQLVAFKLTNPFDRDIVMGRPLLSDVAPNDVTGVTPPAGARPAPNAPLQLVVDPAATYTPAIFAGLGLPPRVDRLPIFSRFSRWATDIVAEGNDAQGVITRASFTGSDQASSVFGGFGRGDTIDVSSPAFLNAPTPIPVDSISDFHYVRFGERTYMLMSLNEQQLYSTSESAQYFAGRPDGLIAEAEVPGTEQRYATPLAGPAGEVLTTLNPIRIPAGKTVVCYALSESPERILKRLRAIQNSNPTRYGMGGTTPNDGGTGPLSDGFVDNQQFLALRTFIQKTVENQVARRTDPSNATDIFNPNGAYWVPMLWEGNGTTPPPGFTNSRLQDINAYVNPIPASAAAPSSPLTQRTATLWRTVRENVRTQPGQPKPLESNWVTVLDPSTVATDFGGNPHTSLAGNAKRPFLTGGELLRLNSNNYANDQMLDRLRIPFQANLASQLQVGDGGEAPKPAVVEGTNTDQFPPAQDNQEPDQRGYTMTFWASVLRPSDPRTNQDVREVPVSPQDRVPADVLPGYCIEAKYWDSDTQAWNLFKENRAWNRYRTESLVQLEVAYPQSDFGIGPISTDSGNRPWQGHAPTLAIWLSRQIGQPITPAAGAPLTLRNVTLADTSGYMNFLWYAPNNIVPDGYLVPVSGSVRPADTGAPARSLQGSIDQRPNATIVTPLPGGAFPPVGAVPGTPLATGFFSFADIYPQVSMDADADRGRLSNNFYRDMDVRRATPQGIAAQFGSQDDHTRWVSILRPADLLRPLGVGPLEVPLDFTNITNPRLRAFTRVPTTALQLVDNNVRYTTLGEALAAAYGYEARTFAGVYTGVENQDPNLLRSPYALVGGGLGEITPNAPYLLKAPPGARGTGTTPQPGDESTDVMLFDRGNLRLHHFVPFVDSSDPDTVLDEASAGANAERAVGAAIPLAQMVLEQFETPATDPMALAEETGQNKPSVIAARMGQININTAPVEVLRVLPMATPHASVVAPLFPSAGEARPSTFDASASVAIGDQNWFGPLSVLNPNPGAGGPPTYTVRGTLPQNQSRDVAAGIAGYRDMMPVLLSRAASAAIEAQGAGALSPFPVAPAVAPEAALFLPTDDGGSENDPFVDANGVSTRSVARVMGIGSQPGYRSVGEVLSARSWANEVLPAGPITNTSRWPGGAFLPQTTTRTTPWAAAPYNIDALGYDTAVANATAPRLELNSTFAELDPSAGRLELGSFDDPYAGVTLTSLARSDANEATRGAANEFDEKLLVANSMLNTITNRSDVFAVWFTLAGFQRSDVEVAPTEPMVPSIQRRFVMVVDRSNVVTRGAKPRILLLKEVPMPLE